MSGEGWKHRTFQAKGIAGVKTLREEVASGRNAKGIVDKKGLKGVKFWEIMEVEGCNVRWNFLGFGNLFGLCLPATASGQ